MNTIEQIKAKIDKLYCEYKDKFHQCGDQYHLGLIDGLDMAEQVLDTLESEKPMNQDGLQKEIQRFLSNATKMDKGEWKGKYPISEMGFGVVARHFAKWGAEHYFKSEFLAKFAEVTGSIDTMPKNILPPSKERERVFRSLLLAMTLKRRRMRMQKSTGLEFLMMGRKTSTMMLM